MSNNTEKHPADKLWNELAAADVDHFYKLLIERAKIINEQIRRANRWLIPVHS